MRTVYLSPLNGAANVWAYAKLVGNTSTLAVRAVHARSRDSPARTTESGADVSRRVSNFRSSEQAQTTG